MRVFLDTSAVFALVCVTDARHREAVAAWESLRAERAELLTTSYVVVESVALVQRRLSVKDSLTVGNLLQRACTVIWVDEALHRRGWQTYEQHERRLLSLVDCVSFATMEQQALRRALAYDEHFQEAGFQVIS